MRALLLVAAVFALAACGEKTEEETVQPDPVAEFEKRAASNLAASQKFLEENAKREAVVTTESGLQYIALEEGPEDGASPKPIDVIDVEYAGTLIDGVEFDSSYARGAAARFRLNQVIPGWIEGLQLMSEGDRYRFFIPPALAYGERGDAPGGPNQALIFDVKLLKVHDLLQNKKQAEAFLAENAEKEDVVTTRSGLQYTVLSEGPKDGKSPTEDNIVKVDYKGVLVNGTEFDSSYARGEPAEFKLGRVIAGWTEGVQLMSEGDKFRFFIPPALAYGEEGTPGGPIAPNEALIFDVELIEVK
ncbi:MAG: FKBP-type peptidyl-prolyl cis-trans isomerase [Parvularculaceae bacterium]